MTADQPGDLAAGFVSSYVGLFDARPDGQTVKEIRIPKIQRDFAQGRDEERDIRTAFVKALHDAVVSGPRLSLDFIYGEIDSEGTFLPLDGQQRLTTLFLLHCYLANRVGIDEPTLPWKKFSYATRAGARTFCDELGKNPGPVDGHSLADWVRDQNWYQYLWRHDPTIQSMLVVLDAIQAAFAADNDVAHQTAWRTWWRTTRRSRSTC